MNGKYILKSGTDFRNFSVITLDFSGKADADEEQAEKSEESEKKKEDSEPVGLQVDISQVDVTKEYEPDAELVSLLEKYKGKLHSDPYTGSSRKFIFADFYDFHALGVLMNCKVARSLFYPN